MSPSLNSFGSNPSVSQLVWDTDLVIPDGKAIESASGEVGIIGDVSISGSLSSEGALTVGDSITIDGYTPRLLQSTGAISYSGGNEPFFIPVVPPTGVRCNGSATLNLINSSPGWRIDLYAKCYSLCGKTADLFIASVKASSERPVVIRFDDVLIPPATQFIDGFYLECVNSKAEITSIDITSASYTSTMLF